MKRKVLALFTIGFVGVAVASISITGALFSASVRISQGIGSGGLVKKSIYLCPNIWEYDSPSYMMHAFSSSESEELTSSKTVSITVSTINMECRVFEFDTTKYDSFVFYRLDPKISGTNYSQVASDTFVLKKISASEDIPLYEHNSDSNHLIARHVTLAVNDTLQVYDTKNKTYYSNVDGSSIYTIDGSGKVKMTKAGTYTIDFYHEHNEGNHIQFTDESKVTNFKWNQTNDISYSDSNNVYRIINWNDGSVSGNSGYNSYLKS